MGNMTSRYSYLNRAPTSSKKRRHCRPYCHHLPVQLHLNRLDLDKARRLLQNVRESPSETNHNGSLSNREIVYVGPSATLSFVQFLRKLFDRNSIASNLDGSVNTDATLENQQTTSPENLPLFEDCQLLQTFVDNFLLIVSPCP